MTGTLCLPPCAPTLITFKPQLIHIQILFFTGFTVYSIESLYSYCSYRIFVLQL